MNEQVFSIKIEKSPLETIRYEGKGTAAHAKSILKDILKMKNSEYLAFFAVAAFALFLSCVLARLLVYLATGY